MLLQLRGSTLLFFPPYLFLGQVINSFGPTSTRDLCFLNVTFHTVIAFKLQYSSSRFMNGQLDGLSRYLIH